MRKLLVVSALLGLLMGIAGASIAAEPKGRAKGPAKPATVKKAAARPMPAKANGPRASERSKGQRAAVVSKGRMGAVQSMGKRHHGQVTHVARRTHGRVTRACAANAPSGDARCVANAPSGDPRCAANARSGDACCAANARPGDARCAANAPPGRGEEGRPVGSGVAGDHWRFARQARAFCLREALVLHVQGRLESARLARSKPQISSRLGTPAGVTSAVAPSRECQCGGRVILAAGLGCTTRSRPVCATRPSGVGTTRAGR